MNIIFENELIRLREAKLSDEEALLHISNDEE
ncbi:hypothetical protein BAMA111019_16115 [Bacillus manliponensis]